MNTFESLGLDARLLKALAQEGYESPTPIQANAIPHVLSGRDLLGIAQTGTGKTASFALPILQRLAANPAVPQNKSARALILSPTRELSAQIADSFRTYGRYMGLSVTTIFGGVSEHGQKQSMARGVDILVATPGRLLDLVNQRAVTLGHSEVFVLDEADRMLDMGFINDIRRLVAHLPKQRQNLFFSATMPQEIGSLASDLLKNPERVTVTPAATTVERIAQRVIHVDTGHKRALLIELLRSDNGMNRTLVFTRTKHGADKIVRALDCAGIVSSAIHGNKSQSQRVATLNAFRAGRSRVLVATDIAARGIDVDGITHVINFDLPHVPESYVHRIGRTARAGAEGIAIAFCDREERALLRDIERVTRQQIPASEWRPANAEVAAAGVLPPPAPRPQKPQRQRDQHGGQRQRDHHAGPRSHAPRQHTAQPYGAETEPHGQQQQRGPKPHRKGGGTHAGKSQPAALAQQIQRQMQSAQDNNPYGSARSAERPQGNQAPKQHRDGPRPQGHGNKPPRKEGRNGQPQHQGKPANRGGNNYPRHGQGANRNARFAG